MRLIDADTLDKVKFHPLPYTHITPSDVNAESYERGWNDAIDAIMSEASTIEERKTGKWQWMSSTYDRIPCELRYMCSVCHHETIFHSNEMGEPWEKFCPNCGARMSE